MTSAQLAAICDENLDRICGSTEQEPDAGENGSSTDE